MLVAVVKYRSSLVQPRLGLCSNFLARRDAGQSVRVWVGRGTFSFPKENETKKQPLIMVGPGTGVAPFRWVFSWGEFVSTNRYI